MKRGVLILLVVAPLVANAQMPRSPREALAPFNHLVGSWRGTGTPAGSREEQRTNFWQETLTVAWKFQADDAWLTLDFDKSKHYRRGELKFVPKDDRFRLKLETVAGKELVLTGALKDRTLTLDDEAGSTRLVVTLLHDNRFLYRQDTRPADKAVFVKQFQVGATKEGVPFAAGDGQPECIVTGGLAKTPVTYQGKTYYVCCSGCRDEFLANPEKYIREAAAKKNKK
jgi:YHS domain-containing protein